MAYDTKAAIERPIPSKAYWAIFYLENTTTNGKSMWDTLDGVYDYLQKQTKYGRKVLFDNILRLKEAGLLGEREEDEGKKAKFMIKEDALVDIYRKRLIYALKKRLEKYEKHYKKALKLYTREGKIPKQLKTSIQFIKDEKDSIRKLKIPKFIKAAILNYFIRKLKTPQFCLFLDTIQNEIDILVDLSFKIHTYEGIPKEIQEFAIRLKRCDDFDEITFNECLKKWD